MARIHARTTHKKALNDPDNHDGVITYLEPDLLECDIKWALSITTNKASGGDGIPGELFKILKMMLLKCCIQYVSKFGKLSSDHRTGKGQFSFQSLRKAIPGIDQSCLGGRGRAEARSQLPDHAEWSVRPARVSAARDTRAAVRGRPEVSARVQLAAVRGQER